MRTAPESIVALGRRSLAGQFRTIDSAAEIVDNIPFHRLMSWCQMPSADRDGTSFDTSLVRLAPVECCGVMDRQSIFALYKLSFHEYLAQTFGWSENFQRERFDVSYRDPELVSVDLGLATAGYAAVKTSVEEIHLSLLLLQPEYRNHGIGRKVMELLMSRAAGSNLPLTLSCFLCNEGAMRFYRGLGFCLVRKDKQFADYRFPAL